MKNYTQHTDRQLVQLFREGETRAMEILVTRYKNGIFSAIFLLIRDSHLAEDLFQDTFIKIINTINKGGYADEGKFLPWAMRIAHNLTIDFLRKEKTKNKKVISYNYENAGIFITQENAESETIKFCNHKTINQIIQNLPQEQREVVVLRHYGDFSFKEIAEITNCNINTALGRMRYALVNLRKMMPENIDIAA